MIFNMSGAGGAGLNFKVVGGPSQPIKPESPPNNILWVDTEHEITSWIIAIKQPAEPEIGMLWISTGKFNDYLFNAIKKNSIQINPNGIYQYVNGGWVDVYAEWSRDGEWIPMKFDLWLFKDGVFNADNFGDYTKDTNVTISSNGIRFPQIGSITTSPNMLYDFSKYARIEYDVTDRAYGGMYVYFMNKSGTVILQKSIIMEDDRSGSQYTSQYHFATDLTIHAEQLSSDICYVRFTSSGNNSSNKSCLNNIRFIPA